MIKDWIINWLEKNSNVTKEIIKKNLNENYFNQGWVDSFTFINFISDLEEHFQITFTNSEFQDKNFSTINGLTEIIKIKKNNETV
ncbi:TPA: acyl carrier protein [Candidatus Galligastranaerophilus faecipullorum]|nr:acyl carrier protein [Candidatus Galligastranaerophilus faecipullorum]